MRYGEAFVEKCWICLEIDMKKHWWKTGAVPCNLFEDCDWSFLGSLMPTFL
jgi:hypothetical protein